MVDLFDCSQGVDEQRQAFEMTHPEYESTKETTVYLENSPHVSLSERSPTSTASGFDRDEDNDVDKSHPTPPTSSAPVSLYSFRDRKTSKLVYDTKYHPMDDAIRPTQAAKRRSLHGEEQVCFSSDDPSEASTTIHTNESDDGHSEAEYESRPAMRCKKRKLAQSRSLVVGPTRRSSRKVSDPKVSYNMNVHPQDEFLIMSSDEEIVPKKKPKRTKHEQSVDKSRSDASVAASRSVKRKHVDYVKNSTCDELESDSGCILPSIEADASTHIAIESPPSSPVAGNLQNGTHDKGNMYIHSVSSGKSCFDHNRYALPALPGQPFSIFTEKFSDQVAHEAHAASPLNYEHDDKENVTDNNYVDMNPLSPTYAGVSVIPETQYKQSSEDRELASHRALVSHALYDDPLPQTYGLDGAHCNGRGDSDAFLEGISILASGAHLPVEKSTN